jgi:hypothetical protein
MKKLIPVFLLIVLCSCVVKQQYCERCARLEKAILNIMYVVEKDNPDYVLDVLYETDEWCVLEELVGPIPPVIITDSTHKKMKQVFPDLPSEPSKPDKPIKQVREYY